MKRPYLNKAGFNKLAQSIKDYINRKITGYDKLGTASTKNFTTYVSPTQTEQLPISSSVYSAMTNMLRGAYHPAGSKTVAELTEDLLVKANLGNVYKITEDGITSDLFIGGAGQTIKTGDNAIVLYASEDTYKFSLESGVVDLDAYQKKELTSGALIEDIIPADASASNQLVTENGVVDKDYSNYDAPNAVRYYSIPITKKQPQNIKMNAQLIFSTVPDTYLITVGAVGGFSMGAKAVRLNNWYDKLTGIWYDETNDVLWFRVNNYGAFTVKIIESVYMEFGSLSGTSTEPSGASWTAPQKLVTESDIPITTTKTSDEGTDTSRTFTLPSHANGDRYKISFSAHQYNSTSSYYGEWVLGFSGTGVTQVGIVTKGSVSMSYNANTYSLTFVTDAQSSFGSIICEKIH